MLPGGHGLLPSAGVPQRSSQRRRCGFAERPYRLSTTSLARTSRVLSALGHEAAMAAPTTEVHVSDTPTQTVAVFNASDDTVEMLMAMLSQRGFRALDGKVDSVKSGEVDFIRFLEEHQVDGLIWDIAPPYDRNWNFFQLVRSVRPLERCAVVLTTTHKRHLDAMAGHDTGAIEIVGKPYDLEVIVDSVIRALQSRDTQSPRMISRRE